ncbi:MAG: lipoyl synthase [Phycisphaerae bacterium]|nr:lipoyl synthase [Phycisphaerae bacterium]
MLTIAQKTKNAGLHVIDSGLAGYKDVLQQQRRLCEERQQGKIPNTVLIAEHHPVITLGARQSANKLLTSRDELMQKQIDVVDIRRGGGVTAHNPGQLVFYPILNLRELGLDISEYIRKLEEIGIELLAQLNITSQRREGFPGLWVNDRKIASIGVRVSKFITYHGMAINIQNDLGIFSHIVPCGLDEVEMTSVLNETEIRYSMNEVKNQLSDILKSHFSRRRLPPWLKRPLPAGDKYISTETVLNSLGINTICSNANCPNRGQCWSKGTATVLILGDTCTRNCKFCSVACGKPLPPDLTEPARIAEMAEQLETKYLIITSVNRDDLPDGGAGHFRDCIEEVRSRCPNIKFEILTPDFRNCQVHAVEILAGALPFVFAHNIETVPSLYRKARTGGNYQRSLNLLKLARQTYANTATKSSIMLGLGETDTEVEQTLIDLRNVGCDKITIGQYLKPSKDSLEVTEYIPPAKFDWWRQRAIELDFKWVISAPFARSSYLAEKRTLL